MTLRTAVSHINRRGALLVFPLQNRKEPGSLWSEFYPRKKMVWNWNESSAQEVGELWRLMKELSVSKKVVYTKWYQNRATFFSKDLFQAMLAQIMVTGKIKQGLDFTSLDILETLENESPLSTKELKRACDLTGKINVTNYNVAMRELYRRMLIVGFGEKDDGVFPSAMMGATSLIFEDLWQGAKLMSPEASQSYISKKLGEDSLFKKKPRQDSFVQSAKPKTIRSSYLIDWK